MSERRARPPRRNDASSSRSSSSGSRSGGPRSGGGGRSGGSRSDGPRSSGGRSGGPRSSGGRSGGPRSSGGRSDSRSFRERDVVSEGEGRTRRPRPAGGAGGDRPARRDDRSDDRPRPRRDDDRPRARRDDDRPRPRRDDDRPRARRDDDRPRRDDRRDDRPRARRDDDRRGPRRDDDRRGPRRDDDRPMTEAQRRSREVRERTGGRQTELSMSQPPKRSREEWIDEGSVRDGKPRRGSSARPQGKPRTGVSQHVIRKTGGARARTSTRPARGGRREVRAMDAVVEEIERAVGARASVRVLRRYEAALASFEAHRYSEARIVLVPLARECADVAAIRELLGLCYYRESNWKKAVEHIEASLALNPGWIFNHAVLADCHRALGNFSRVDELWEEIGEASPHPELLAEARIVYAMSNVDQGDLTKALSIMVKTLTTPKRIQEYHLRQWYVLADIHDRLGNIIKAREVFERIADIDPNFADVAERMSDLGA